VDPLKAWSVRCDTCGGEAAFSIQVRGCAHCAHGGRTGVLQARFRPPQSPQAPIANVPRGMLRYRALLPGGDAMQSLGEGDTPLVPSRQVGPALGLSRLWFKLEGCNPTGSFKDRYCAVSVNLARRFGYERIVVSSTGNLGVSAAAYAAALGLECLLVALTETPDAVLEQASAHGARIVTTHRDRRQQVFERIAARPGWFPVGLLLPRPVQNPYGVEGYRTLAWEMLEALGAAPDAVLFPCARGNGLHGAWKGFLEARAWGWCEHVPRMGACQPRGANSIEVTLARGADHAVELTPVQSIAASASETVSDDRAIAAVRDSGGFAASCDDASLLDATRALAREGLYVEPSSALPVACLQGLMSDGVLDRDATVVCVLTASGVRWSRHLRGTREPFPHISNPEDVDAVVDAGTRTGP
jgi:threonine synthase